MDKMAQDKRETFGERPPHPENRVFSCTSCLYPAHGWGFLSLIDEL